MIGYDVESFLEIDGSNHGFPLAIKLEILFILINITTDKKDF